jgi:hypothetical protein
VTHPALENTLVGDGTVIRSHYRGWPGKRQLNRETGELEQVKFDPDADYFDTGDGDKPYGIKFGLIESWLPYENERLIHDIFSIRNEDGRDEAAEAIRSITALVELLPDAQAVSWDMALHGVHFDTTRRLGLIDIVKVQKTAARAGRKIPPPKDEHGKRCKGHLFKLSDDTTRELDLYTLDGNPHIEAIAEGKKHKVPLTKTRLRRIEHRSEGFRLYGDYRVPDDPRIPKDLRHATVTIRLSHTEDDGKYNRAENLRPITIHDPIEGTNPDLGHQNEFDQRRVLRPGAESMNRWLKQHFNDKRAPAVGIGRIMFMLICAALLNNAKAVLAQHVRLRQAAAA